MHKSEICYKIKCNETETKISDKNIGSWTESDDQLGHILGPAIYLILLYCKLCEKFPFVI